MQPELIPAWIDDQLQPVEKLDVHRRGLRHKAISVFVLNQGRILLQQRALTKYHSPGLWANTCCTHPHWGESSQACALRRLHQELGIDGLALTHRGEVEYRADVGQGLTEHELVQIYVADAPDDLVLTLNPAEVADVTWMTMVELDLAMVDRCEDFTVWLKIYLDEHRDMIFR